MEYYLACVCIAFIMGYAFKKHKKYKRKNLEIIHFEDIMHSEEPFILFLRAFDDDSRGRATPVSLFTLNVQQLASFEEEISSEVKPHKFIAVGKPQEEFPELGAFRMYVDHDSWKDQVFQLIKKAHLIIIKPSFSEGLNWEINTVLKNGFIAKLVFYHLFGDVIDKKVQHFYYKKFKKNMTEAYDLELQKFEPKARYSYFSEDNKHHQINSLKAVPKLLELNLATSRN